MDYLACLAVGFLLGVIATLKVTIVVQETRRRAKVQPPAEQRELRVATVDGQVMEDFP